MKLINRFLFFIYSISLISAIFFFLLLMIGLVIRMVSGNPWSFLYKSRLDFFVYSVIAMIFSAFLSNQIDKIIQKIPKKRG